MASVTLRQGTYTGLQNDGTDSFYGIQYAAPFDRYQPPSPPVTSNAHFSATQYGAICPQSPSRLGIVMGPMPPNAGPQSESHCSVLSVHAPINRTGEHLPVIVFTHGGAWISGGSQIPWYDGARLARDGNVVVVVINYRLGIFGYLPDETQPIPPGTLDVIAAYEWVRDNISAFGGNSSNVTGVGQSAGAFNTASLIQIRPDLFKRAIVQSGPGIIRQPQERLKQVREKATQSLSAGITLTNASIQDLLAAQFTCIKTFGGLLPPFIPSIPSSENKESPDKKDVLIGWTKDDGNCFATMIPDADASSTAEVGASITKKTFKEPAYELAELLRSQGHTATLYELTWAPEGFDLGATHCIDLPLLFGTEQSWKDAPILGKTPWGEWDRRGKKLREAWSAFARDGTKPSSWDGVEVFS